MDSNSAATPSVKSTTSTTVSNDGSSETISTISTESATILSPLSAISPVSAPTASSNTVSSSTTSIPIITTRTIDCNDGVRRVEKTPTTSNSSEAQCGSSERQSSTALLNFECHPQTEPDRTNLNVYFMLLTREQVYGCADADYVSSSPNISTFSASEIANGVSARSFLDRLRPGEEREHMRLQILAPVFLDFLIGVIHANFRYRAEGGTRGEN